MDPDALGGEGVRAGDVDGHGAGRRVDALDGFDEFLGEALADQVVALLEELG
ncbi:MAG: hypothetical protein JNK25_06535 [Phycisphaerae bacterium]|nr:hypothetical protein [Phycisphaerae bacterium]